MKKQRQVNLTNMNKFDRLYGKTENDVPYLTNGKWLIRYIPGLVNLGPVLENHLLNGKAFRWQDGILETSEIANVTNMAAVIAPAMEGQIEVKQTDVLLQSQGEDSSLRRLFVDDKGNLYEVDEAFLSLLEPILSLALAIKIAGNDAPLAFFEADGKLLALIMPLRSEIPKAIIEAFKREAKLAKKETVAA